jgi:hypothetical protein
MSILILIQTASLIALFNHIWFETDFFAFYAKAFKKLIPTKTYLYLMVEEYFIRPSHDFIYNSYIEYFSSKRSFSNNFFEIFIIKLVSCPICLTTWISILYCAFLGNIFYIGILFILVRCLDGLLKFFLKTK